MLVAPFTADLDALHAAVAPRFRRPEVRARARRYLDGLLGGSTRKSGWQLAEALSEHTPDGIQRLLNAAQWDADAVRAGCPSGRLQGYVVAHFGDTDAVLVVDETGFLAAGGTSMTYTYALAPMSAALPPGLMLAANGTLSGTPTMAGMYPFTVRATDANIFTGDKAYTVTVNAAVAVAPATLPNGTGTGHTFAVTGGGCLRVSPSRRMARSPARRWRQG